MKYIKVANEVLSDKEALHKMLVAQFGKYERYEVDHSGGYASGYISVIAVYIGNG